MSWREAHTIAEKFYRELRTQHAPGFIRMVIRALLRMLNRDERKKNANPIPK